MIAPIGRIKNPAPNVIRASISDAKAFSFGKKVRPIEDA
jgi:hypothetical protein